MKLEQNPKSMLFSFTEIPDVFFTEYLTMANGNFIKIYLYILFLSKYNKDIKINDLSKTLSLDFKIIQEGLKFWEDNGVLTKKNNGYILNSLQEIALNKIYTPRLTATPKKAAQNAKNKYRAKAIENINNSYFQGIMSPSWYTDINLWFDKYNFDEQVMIALFRYCFDKSALHRNYVQVVADSWSKNNIKTYTDLENYYQKQEKLFLVEKFISKKLGLSRLLTQYEKAFIEKWVLDYRYGNDIIELALKKTTSKSNPNFDYINSLLTDWNDRNLRTKEDINNYIENMKKKNKDLKDLKKKTDLANYEQRKYNNLDKFYTNLNSNK